MIAATSTCLLILSSGFNHDDIWGHRAAEPQKAVICSIALARLRTDIKGDTAGATNAVGMAQKLLLFWRKPARRCWWEGVELDDVEGVEGKLKVWIRRVWTLEMVSRHSLPSSDSHQLTSTSTERNRAALNRTERLSLRPCTQASAIRRLGKLDQHSTQAREHMPRNLDTLRRTQAPLFFTS